MIARAVIGANFGDEGKGLVTDYLSSIGGNVVVRFNGGAQAGHTVVTPEGKRHVFSHFSSGSFNGLPTYLSEFFVCNPILFFKEAETLSKVCKLPDVYAHPSCLVTTFADMIINQRLESKRGSDRHGSCGVGISETIERSAVSHLTITMADLWAGRNLEPIIEEICDKYAEFRTGSAVVEADMAQAFIKGCAKFAEFVHPMGIEQCTDPIFEGAQGLLLDQNNMEYFPHLTRSNTGMKNVRHLCQQAGITDIEPYYVSRTYLTRHGAGPLPGEDPALSYTDSTNTSNAWQGNLRFAPLTVGSWDRMIQRCMEDCGGDFKMVLTHCDQKEPPAIADLYSYGPSRSDLVTIRK